MKIMGVLSCIGAVFALIAGVSTVFSHWPVLGIVTLGVGLVACMIALAWFRWLKEDNSDNRDGVVKWMRIGVLLTIVYAIAMVLLFMWYSLSPVAQIINGALNTLLNIYFYQVTKKTFA